MNRTVIAATIMALLGTASLGAQAALTNGMVLSFGGAGSCFGMQGSYGCPTPQPGLTGQALVSHNGIVLGTSQTAAGYHVGLPNGSETPNIDNPFVFFGSTGLHESVSPINVLSASGNTATVDFSSWTWLWQFDVALVGSGAWAGNPDGVANVVCGVDCSVGDTYTLTYSGTITQNPILSGVQYWLQLQGTITAVPLPTAAWLFGSGLVGLLGAASYKKR